MKKFIILLSISLIVNVGIYSQKGPEKFGKNIEKHLKAKVCPIDSSAGAYVIFNFGNINFEYTSYSGFTWTQTHHIRIKILNKNEFDQASFSIPIYYSNEGAEKIFDLKGVSYNLKNEKIIESKINTNDGIIEERSEYWNLFKFALPNVVEGTVIEVSYKLKSQFLTNLRDWVFQMDIPVLHSEVYFNIPEYYNYSQNMKGYFPLTIAEQENLIGNLTYKNDGDIDLVSMNRTSASLETVQYNIISKHYVANNVMALKGEDFVDNMENYRSSIEFELSHSEFGMNLKEYNTSWEVISKNLLAATYFGEKLNKIGYAKDKVEELMEKYPDKHELMNAIYSHVQEKIKWNNTTSFYDNKTLKEVYNKESGSSSDINFILINMLREAGFNALPVALSTRNNGIIFSNFPTRDQFNNMIALVILDEENILLDASSSHCPPGVLPTRCLNGKGRIIDQEYNTWIDLEPKGKYDKTIMYDLKIGESGEFNGNLSVSRKAYAAINFREQVESALSIEKIMEEFEEDNSGIEVLSHEFTGLEEPHGPVVSNFEVQINEQSDFMGDIIIFNPLLYERTLNNPFKMEEREYPVNYTYLRDYKYLYKYEIPDGFEIESLPDPLVIANQDKSVRYVYSASQIGNTINLTVTLNINKVLFLQNEYYELKELYNLLVAKEAEQIILKKITSP